MAFQALAAAADDGELRAEVELDLAYFCMSLGDLPAAEQHARSAVAAAEIAGAPSVRSRTIRLPSQGRDAF